MVKLVDVDGKKTAVVNVFIDPERGFLDVSLTPQQGGVLYVPAGEEVVDGIGEIIKKSRDSIFVIGQDYHPKNHISFMTNHPGVMEYRQQQFIQFLQDHGQPVPRDAEELRSVMQQPVHFFSGYDNPPEPFAFNEVVLDGAGNVVGLKREDGKIHKVEVTTASGLAPNEDDRGRVTRVLEDTYPKTFDEMRADGVLLSTQTLWTQHCIQGTESCLFPEGLNLPPALKDKLEGDLMTRSVYARDPETGNEFYVVRKGNNSEVDSYGIGVENDGETFTPAFGVFADIAKKLKAQGCEQVIVNVGGLATNFCVEFSANNIADFLAGHFKMKGMDTQINLVPEISRGIPIPGGPEVPFSLDGTPGRLEASRNIGTASVADILAYQAPGLEIKPGTNITGDELRATNGNEPVQQRA